MSTTTTRFSINLDLYDGRMFDVKEIVATKVAKCAAEVAEDEHDNERTVRMRHSPTTGQTVDKKMENFEDTTDK